MDSEKTKSKTKQGLLLLVLLMLALLTLIPFFWMLSSSLKQNNQVFSVPMKWLPEVFKWENYVEIWKLVDLATFFKNTVFLSVTITVLTLLTSSFAAYGFSKMKFRGRDGLFLLYVATIAVPVQVFMIPQYILMTKLGLTDTLASLVLLQSFSAFGVFLMKQFYESIPDSLCESARMDGLGEWGIYSKIILPLTKPAIASLAIITFVNTWNDYMGPFIYLSSSENLTIQVGLNMFVGLFSAKYAYIMAASVVSIIPIAIVFIVMQKYFVEGIATSGMKG